MTIFFIGYGTCLFFIDIDDRICWVVRTIFRFFFRVVKLLFLALAIYLAGAVFVAFYIEIKKRRDLGFPNQVD